MLYDLGYNMRELLKLCEFITSHYIPLLWRTFISCGGRNNPWVQPRDFVALGSHCIGSCHEFRVISLMLESSSVHRRPKLTIREIDRINDLCKRMNDLCKRMSDLCKRFEWDVTT